MVRAGGESCRCDRAGTQRAVPALLRQGKVSSGGWGAGTQGTHVHGVDIVGKDLVEGLERALVPGCHLPQQQRGFLYLSGLDGCQDIDERGDYFVSGQLAFHHGPSKQPSQPSTNTPTAYQAPSHPFQASIRVNSAPCRRRRCTDPGAQTTRGPPPPAATPPAFMLSLVAGRQERLDDK